MACRIPILTVASLVLLAGGAAAANTLLMGPSPGIAVGGGSVVAQTATPAAGPSTGVPGTPGGQATTGPSTGATTTTAGPPATGTVTNGTPTTAVTAPTVAAQAIDQIVSLTRTVAPGVTVSALTVPLGQQLVITDVLVTNPGTSPACGAGVSAGGTVAATPPGTAVTSGLTEAGTGLLCVPPQTSLPLALTTGLEFTGGQSVVLANAATGTEAATTLHYHLRGFLVSTLGG
jgi:hypothetical protein